jgi:hypothetical protein
MKKQLNTGKIMNELRESSAFFPKPPDKHQEVKEVVPLNADPNPKAPTQHSTYLSKRPSKPLSKGLSKRPTTEDIEQLSFKLRKIPKSRINGDVPDLWKQQIDDLAHELCGKVRISHVYHR